MSDNWTGILNITDSNITANTDGGADWGGAGSAMGVNAAAVNVSNSTVQGYP